MDRFSDQEGTTPAPASPSSALPRPPAPVARRAAAVPPQQPLGVALRRGPQRIGGPDGRRLPRHDRILAGPCRRGLVGQEARRFQERVPGRRTAAGPADVHGHDGRHRPRRGLHRRRCGPGLQLRDLRCRHGLRHRAGAAGAEHLLLRPDRPAARVHGRRDALAALWRRRQRHLRRGDVDVHAHAGRDLDDRLCQRLRRAVRRTALGRDRHRRHNRRRLLGARRHVVHHAHRHGAVRGQERGRAPPAAAHRGGQGRRLRRHGRPAAARLPVPDLHRRADNLHLCADLHLRHAHRAGHLAAGLHRPQRKGRRVGRHRCRGLLPRLRPGSAFIGMATKVLHPGWPAPTKRSPLSSSTPCLPGSRDWSWPLPCPR